MSNAQEPTSEAHVDKAVFGVTLLEGEIFVLGFYSTVVRVYDPDTLVFKRQWEIPELECPGDIKTWPGRNCMFLLDWTDIGKKKQMYIVDAFGNIQQTWKTEDDFGRLFIYQDRHEITIVEDFHDQKALSEFQTDGKQLLKLPLGIEGLQHAIKLTGGHYVVSHGDPKDTFHRVCKVNRSGEVVKSFGGEKGSGEDQFNVPVYLALTGDGSILVVDKYNGRIRLLSSELEFRRDVLTRENGLKYPVKIYVDETKGRIYVADNDQGSGKTAKGRILRFDVPVDGVPT